MIVNKDQVKGRVAKTKGSVKEAVGRATGNTRLAANGNMQKNVGKFQATYGDIKRGAKKRGV